MSAQKTVGRFASMSRRAAITAAALGALALAGCGGGGDAPAQGDMALGAPEGAAVTVIEYASVTCGHCAVWNETVWPEFKAKYVDTNKVRYIFREFPTPPMDIAAAGFLLARCAGDDRYFEVVDQVMRSQQEWIAGAPPRESLLRIAASAGMDQQEFQQCVSDPQAVAAFEQRIQQGRAAGIAATPTFMVNGQQVADTSLAGLSAAIDPLLAE
jgi:protein-disulfide isomerase